MGIFGKIFADRRKYKVAYRLSQTLHPYHSRIWTDRIVKMPDNPYAFTGTGTLISSDDMYPYAVYTDFPGSEGIVAEVLAGDQFWVVEDVPDADGPEKLGNVLNEYYMSVAREGIGIAETLAGHWKEATRGTPLVIPDGMELVRERLDQAENERHEIVVFCFAFMNWIMANGVWSTLTDSRIRRNAMAASLTSFAETHLEYCEREGFVLFTSDNTQEDWYSEAQKYRDYIKTQKSFGTEEAAKYALELIQDNVPFSWIQMNNYVPRFAELARDDMDKIQETAARLKDLTR